MNIGILGAKNIGSTLARKWVSAGHRILLGVRNTQNPELIALVEALGKNASSGSVADAIQFGEVVVFAIPGNAMDETIRSNAALLDGKIIIDAANRMGEREMNSYQTFRTHTPHAKIYRAFNNLGWENFEMPVIQGVQVDLFYCGDEGESQHKVDQLIRDIQLNPVYLGDMSNVHPVDMIALLWFRLAFGQKLGRRIAFKLLTE
jgi:predicted dinucleotide-binding enzyme